MHELGLAMQTLDIVLEEAGRQKAERVLSMRMRVGELSGVVPEALQFALETIMEDTPAEGARINIDLVKPACECASCGMEFEVINYDYSCRRCGEISSELSRGKEMNLISLEVV